MKLGNKVLLSGLASVFMFSLISEAGAARRLVTEESSDTGAILFRIENIQPIENKEGLIDKCSFVLTAYNRMEKGVKDATLNLSWADNISGKYEVTANAVKAVSGAAAEKVVKTTINLASIAPHTQKSFEGVVNTDKCYLLFDNLEYTVASCINDGDKIVVKNNKAVSSGGGCSGNFNYINSKNPEYYSEFKDVPDSVVEKQLEEEKENEVARITENYRGVIMELENIGKTLNKIQ